MNNSKFFQLGYPMKVLLFIIGICSLMNFGNANAEDLKKIDFHFDWRYPQMYAGYFVALDKGFYQEEGLDVSLKDGSGAMTNMKLIGQKKFLMAAGQATATIKARVAGIPVVSVAMSQQFPGYVILSLKKSGIHSPDDLIGKKIGVIAGTALIDVCNAFLDKTNIDRDEVEKVMTRELTSALVTGKVDAIIATKYSLVGKTELMGLKTNKIDVEDYGINWYGANLVVHEDLIKQRPEYVRRFVRATLKGWKYMLFHPDETVRIIMKNRPASNRKYIEKGVESMIELVRGRGNGKFIVGVQEKNRWASMQEDLLRSGLIKKKVISTSLFTNQFLPEK